MAAGWPSLHDPTLLAGVVQALGSVLAGIIAAGTALVALGAWRNQELGKRAIQYAADAMSEADEVVDYVGVARSRVTTVSIENTERSFERIHRLVVQSQVDALGRARDAGMRCRGSLRRLDLVTGRDHQALADGIVAPVGRLAQMHLVVQYLSDPPPEGAGQRDALARAKTDFLGLPREGSGIPVEDWFTFEDDIQKNLSKAHRKLEAALRSVLQSSSRTANRFPGALQNKR